MKFLDCLLIIVGIAFIVAVYYAGTAALRMVFNFCAVMCGVAVGVRAGLRERKNLEK